MRQSGRLAAVFGAIVFVAALVTGVGAVSPARATPGGCTPVLAGTRSGSEAVAELGANLPAAAAKAQMSPDRFAATLVADSSYRVDVCGRTFVVEDKSPGAGANRGATQDPGTPTTPGDTDNKGANAAPGAAAGNSNGLDASGDAFNLNSRPGSQRTIYLDFDGALITGTMWNYEIYDGDDFYLVAFSQDADTGNFSAAERDAIREIWLSVAEDYAPFDVNVTTRDPGYAAIGRSDEADQVYGSTALITSDEDLVAMCECGGAAYLGVFNEIGWYHDFAQPALVLERGLANTRDVAESAAHEMGHNLALLHDGTVAHGGVPAVEYYGGQGVWAPIMGESYYKPLSQWSRGEYDWASTTENDLLVMLGNGLPPVQDDHPNAAPGTAISSGVAADGTISAATDTDWFRFSGMGASTINVVTQSVGADLDVRVELRDANGAVVAAADPPVGVGPYNTATGLSASMSVNLAPGTYDVKIDGVGSGDPRTAGYSDYGSLGRYQVSVTTQPAPPAAPTGLVATAADGRVNVSWQPPGFTGGSPITNYRVTAAPSGETCETTGAPSCDVLDLVNDSPYTFTVTATNQAQKTSVASTPAGPVTPKLAPGSLVTSVASVFVPVSPARVYDSRWSPSAGVAVGPLAAGGGRAVSVADGRNSGSGAVATPDVVPVGATAVAYNLTVADSVGSGFLALMPGDAGGYTASTINWSGPGQQIANGLAVGVDSVRQVRAFAGGPGSAHFVLDVVGYYLPEQVDQDGGVLTPITPVRAVDTRGGAGPVGFGGSRLVPLTAPAGATAVAYNLTAVGMTGPGFLSVVPGNETGYTASSLNWSKAGEVIANGLTVGLDSSRALRVFASYGAATDFIIDVVGYYSPADQTPAGGRFYPIDPIRVFDSRDPLPAPGMLASGAQLRLGVADSRAIASGSLNKMDVVPPGAQAIMFNATVAGTTGPGFISLVPADASSYSVSTLNWPAAGAIRANGSVIGVDDYRRVRIFGGGGAAAHVVLDTTGYFK